jgi:hypothetical protein
MIIENSIEQLSIIEHFDIQQPTEKGVIIEANPFIGITDATSFNLAKKTRTTLKNNTHRH